MGELSEQLRGLEIQVARLAGEIIQRAKDNHIARRLMTIRAIGAITAAAITALAPAAATFRRNP